MYFSIEKLKNNNWKSCFNHVFSPCPLPLGAEIKKFQKLVLRYLYFKYFEVRSIWICIFSLKNEGKYKKNSFCPPGGQWVPKGVWKIDKNLFSALPNIHIKFHQKSGWLFRRSMVIKIVTREFYILDLKRIICIRNYKVFSSKTFFLHDPVFHFISNFFVRREWV